MVSLSLFSRLLEWRRLVAACAIVVMAATFAACAGESPNEGPGESDPGRLIVYSGRAETLVRPIIQQFEELTGVSVEVRYGGTPEIAATLLEEGTRSPADVFYAQDPGGLGVVAEAGLLTPLPANVLERIPEWVRANDGIWVGISGRARVLTYDSRSVDVNELPADIFDLIDPKWDGRLGWAPTNGSFLAMVTGMRYYWGEDKTREWIEGMVANNPAVYPNNTSQVVAVGAGEIEVGIVNHYYLYRFFAEEGEDFPARNYHPTEGPGALVMISGAGILENGPNRANAERFVSFLTGAVAQQYFASQTFEYPLTEGVNVHRLLTPLDEINRPEIPMSEMADLEGTTELLRQAGALP